MLICYQGDRKKATIDLKNTACHTLHYNKLTQTIVPLNYTNSVSVYSIEGHFDTELRYLLRGHKSIVTCIDSLSHSPLMITGDDTGEVRIW